MRKLRLPRHGLEGEFVVLEPLDEQLREQVRIAFASDPEAWKLLVHDGGPGAFESWWGRTRGAMRKGTSWIFAVRRQSDSVIVGTSGFLSIEHMHRRVEIGSTFYQPDARGTAVNPECKLLLIDSAFRAGANRVEFLTDVLNLRSRTALSKLGAIEEGVLRRHKITWTGRVRDSAIFSITDLEWEEKRKLLQQRVDLLIRSECRPGVAGNPRSSA